MESVPYFKALPRPNDLAVIIGIGTYQTLYIKPLVEDEAKQLNVQQSPSLSPDVEKLKGRFSLRK